MNDIVIRVENLSKQYRLGEVSTNTISHDLNRWWARIRGKEDPFLKVGESNDRTRSGNSDYVWALRDIDFEVRQGEVLGIVGRNGAGKSTLLKILSKTTTPSTGAVKLKGRIASLLEVGTGFHPEMTGRENVFLNGAILGMTQKEIKGKFDEIVDFAGVERYIDTPVKRYSSGMYVRLAFGVAAHLEPEILIVDEVLAVGDAEFQKKCLGKMKDVSINEGRTVLFVSHNLVAVQSLCTQAILLELGKVSQIGEVQNVISAYLNKIKGNELEKEWLVKNEAPGNEYVRVRKITAFPCFDDNSDKISVVTPIEISFEFWNLLPELEFNLSLHLYNSLREVVFASVTPRYVSSSPLISLKCTIPGNLLNDGMYYISMMIVKEGRSLYFLEEVIRFEVHDIERSIGWLGKWPGYVRPKLEWTLI